MGGGEQGGWVTTKQRDRESVHWKLQSLSVLICNFFPEGKSFKIVQLR